MSVATISTFCIVVHLSIHISAKAEAQKLLMSMKTGEKTINMKTENSLKCLKKLQGQLHLLTEFM